MSHTKYLLMYNYRHKLLYVILILSYVASNLFWGNILVWADLSKLKLVVELVMTLTPAQKLV